ncbi:6845_t:CDS:2 [Paraglomus occultum]|uniref:6845_t:CDS:1 n=1 Tax=Paraglomus occultum TaxID=144539 RepID=A0A9N9CH68_9GLOM|nr:6845_t:CDS:2 [Paraglomus occultum]
MPAFGDTFTNYVAEHLDCSNIAIHDLYVITVNPTRQMTTDFGNTAFQQSPYQQVSRGTLSPEEIQNINK